MRNNQQETAFEKKLNRKLEASKKLRLYLYQIEAEYRRRNKTAEMVKLFRFLTH